MHICGFSAVVYRQECESRRVSDLATLAGVWLVGQVPISTRWPKVLAWYVMTSLFSHTHVVRFSPALQTSLGSVVCVCVCLHIDAT